MKSTAKDAAYYFADTAATVKSKLNDEQLQVFLNADLSNNSYEDEDIISEVETSFQESFYEWEKIIQKIIKET